jgi:hypothetical protein
MAQRAIILISPINIFVQEGKLALTLDLHVELNALAQEVLPLVRFMWLVDEGVVHVVKPAESFWGAKSSAAI